MSPDQFDYYGRLLVMTGMWIVFIVVPVVMLSAAFVDTVDGWLRNRRKP